ncbi:unnamed protein product [Kuraishia capsulata CBS 1993]|uniref:DNA-directed RNA polymerase subunit n=1 Tax=Kuraishia capsulata CBS 1993 TaxID=1382522 RepID=W6MQL1_9ASCO|nr:uncharacterized protein KUCA_T00004607001 [Kuraishia capsulata CBS 1993]CDK28623.1 unnamed protein product [Kuraishia capsulata CBS 1993]
MFQLSVISDLIRISPHIFNLPTDEAVLNELNEKYANKVIHNLGLVVTIWDISKIEDGMLKPGDGCTYIKVVFRCVVWKPFVGEVLTGWIDQASEQGLKVKLEFFNDIFIPGDYLFEGSVFSKEDNAWIWQPDESTKLYLDVNEKINFRVEEEMFTNVKPKGPTNTVVDDETGEKKESVPPYAIVGSCQTDGMGCVSWWE